MLRNVPQGGLAAILGLTVEGVLTGRQTSSRGVEMKGIAGPVWFYADLLVRLGDGRVLSLSPGRCVLLSGEPPGAVPWAPGEPCIGKPVLDLLTAEDGEPCLYLLLEGGSYLEHSYGPGGSHHLLGDLHEWSLEDLGGSIVSLISGEVLAWRSLVTSPRHAPEKT